jgi:predicted RecA/RadA family phage recombinase
MQNQISKGDAINVAAPPGGVVAGQGYLIGSLFGVSPVTAAAGVQIALRLVGVYTLVKNFGEAWTVGQLLLGQHCQAVHHDFDVEHQDRHCDRSGGEPVQHR